MSVHFSLLQLHELMHKTHTRQPSQPKDVDSTCINSSY